MREEWSTKLFRRFVYQVEFELNLDRVPCLRQNE